MNKYRDRIINMGKKNNSRIILPEVNDKRIQEASSELSAMGFHILNPMDFQNNRDYYLDYINGLTFTDNWPMQSLKDYLDDPIHFSMVMLACDD